MSEYSKRFQSGEAAEHYDEAVYAPASRDSFIWSLQKEYLTRLAASLRQDRGSLRYLDFACGTGRVLEALQPFGTAVDAVDIAEAMAERARRRVPSARVAVGDVLEMPEIIGLCTRVAVMREGRIVGILEGEEISEQEIMRYSAGLKKKTAA